MNRPEIEKDQEQVIKAYLDIDFPGALGGIQRFYGEFKKKHPENSLTFEKVKEAVETLPVYQLHVTKRKSFERRKYKLPPGSSGKTSMLISGRRRRNADRLDFSIFQ